MRLGGTQTIIACEEHSEVAVTLSELLSDGELDIYPEIASKGYFLVSYRRGAITLRATRFVGLIPISDRVAIHVRPKAPIGNLLWFVWRSGLNLPALDGAVRSYLEAPEEIDDPEALYVDAFLSTLSRISTRGVLKRYRSWETDLEWRGRLKVAQSIGRFYGKGIRYRHVFQPTELTVDNFENRCIKHTTIRILRHLSNDPSGQGQKLALAMKKHLELLFLVDESQLHSHQIARHALRFLHGIPCTHDHYVSAIWLAYLIATGKTVILDKVGPTKFESIVLDVSAVFESYIRTLCEESQPLFACDVQDGNRLPLNLFTHGISAKVQPDIYFVHKGKTIAIIDVKYKRNPSEQDRYQLLAFCEASSAKRAAFVCPAIGSDEKRSHYGTTPGGIHIDLFRVDLATSDLSAEEDRFASEIAKFIEEARGS